MKKFISILALALIALVPAAADTILVGQSITYNYTINAGQQNGDGNSATGPITATATFSLNAAGTQMTITITNTTVSAGGLNVRPSISGLGFDSTPTLTTGAITGSTGQMTTWNLASGSGAGLGIGGYEVRTGDTGPCNIGPVPGTSNDGICAGESGSITFNISPTIGANGLQIDRTALHIQSTIGSWKPEGTPGGEVPEPASLALLGTGLLSAGGFIRRKLNK